MKQEAHTELAAMSRDHVTDEDIETFKCVQRLAAQVNTTYCFTVFYDDL